LVTDAIKGSDHMFYAHLIDAKESTVAGRGSYIRTSIDTGDVTRITLVLSKQLEEPRRVARREITLQRQWFEPEMVFVEGGTFTMGCVPERDGVCFTADNREIPPRRVTVSSFNIGKYEVTREQWNAVVAMSGHTTLPMGCWKNDDQQPIQCVSWLDIDTFLMELNALTGRTTEATKYRLLTSAEWEYAARGCKASVCDDYMYSGSNVIDDVSWYGGNSTINGTRILPVGGGKKPNRLGIYDMSGGVWEWCADMFDASYYNTLADGIVDPTGPTTSSLPVFRGGSITEPIVWSRVAARLYGNPARRDYSTGFRVALPAQ
jgi:formylglycine-generating enzyme required for sulfatase activity